MKSSHVHEWLTAFGEAHHGVVGLRQAQRDGLSYEAIRHQVERGTLVRLASGVFRLAHHPPTWESRLWAAILEAGTHHAVASHRASARLHGLYTYRASDSIDVTVRRGASHHLTLGRLHETSLLDADHVVVVQGFPCTSLARTIFDLCGDPDHRPLRTEGQREVHRQAMHRVINEALRDGLTVERELAVLAAIGKRGRPGTALVREVFEQYGCRYRPDESTLETVFSQLVRSAGLPAPVKQQVFRDEDGFIGRVDFWWPDHRVVVEIDSWWHDGPIDRARDAERDARLAELGITVVRLRWRDLVIHPDQTMRKLRKMLAASGAAVISGPTAPEITAHWIP